MKEKGIDIQLRFESVTGYTQDQMIPVEEVVTNDSRVYYAIDKFVQLFGLSNKTVRRRADKLGAVGKHLTVIRLGNKRYFHKSLHKAGKPDYLKSIYTPSGEDIQGLQRGEDLRVAIDLSSAAPFNEETYTPVTGVTFDNGLIYYEIEMFCKRFGISASSVYDYIDRIYRHRYRYCLSIGGKHYVSPGILFFKKKYLPQLKNLEYAGFLNCYTWTLAGSVRYVDNDYHSADRCITMMKKMAMYLKKQYPNELHTFFYVTEKNKGDGGFHSHFVYGIQNPNICIKTLIERIEKFITKCNGDYQRQILTEPIDQKDFFIEYMVKQMHDNPDHYGWMDHNLLV